MDPRHTAARLSGLLEATRHARSGSDLRALLASTARTVAEELGYATVAVNVYRPAWDDLEVAAVHGRREPVEALTGSTTPRSVWEPLLHRRFQHGGAYFIPHGSVDWAADGVASYIPDLPASDDPDAWHAEDALLVPLRRSDGRLLGILSVDEPSSGRRPHEEELDFLAAVAAGIAQAIESAQEEEAAGRHRAALERLLAVSTELGRNRSPEAVLQLVCDGIAEALAFGLVVVELADREADLYRPVAAAGIDLGHTDVQLYATIDALDGVFDPEFEREGCYLLGREEAVARVRDEPTAFASSANGQGPHAWNRHWLLVPLHDRQGTRLGFIWVDNPVDRLIPSRERLQALRLFADQAEGALESAAQFTRLREAKQDLERRNAELEALHETTLGLIERLEPAGALDAIVSRAAALLDTQNGFVYLVDEADALLELKVGHGHFDRGRSAALGRGEGLAGRVWASGSALAVDDYYTWEGQCERLVRTTFRAVAGVPLRFGNRVVGVLGVASDDPARRFGDSELRLLDRFAHLASLLLETARLDEQAHREAGVKQAIIEASPAAILAVDGEQNVTLWNPAAQGIFGWSAGELLGRPLPTDPGERSAEFVDAVERVLRGGAITSYETERRRKDGTLVQLTGSAAPIRGEGGSIVGAMATLADISARKRAEAELARRNAELEALHETTLELITQLEPARALETIVVRAAALAGTDSGLLALVEDGRLVPAVEIGLFAEDPGARLGLGEGLGGRVWSQNRPLAVDDYVDWPGRSPNVSAERIRALAGVPLRAGNEVIGVLSVGHREPGRRFDEAELALLARFGQLASLALQNARLYARARRDDDAKRAIIEASPLAIVALDRGGHVRSWNAAAEQIFGWTAEEAVGGFPPQLTREDLAEFRVTVARALAGETITGEHSRRRKDGTSVEVSVSSAPIRGADNEITGLIATIADVTARRRAEADLARHVAELEALHETTLDLIDQLDARSVLETIIARATELLESAGGYIYLVDEAADELEVAIDYGAYSGTPDTRLRRGEGLSGRVWAEARPLAIENYSEWEGRIELYDSLGMQSLAATPLRSGTTVVGVLGVSRAEPERPYTEGEMALLVRFGQLASLALDNARLYEAAQRELEERRQAEEALRASQELHRKVLDHTADLISLVDLEGRIVLASASHEAVLGYTADELVGTSALDLVHPDDAAGAATALRSGEPAIARVRGREGGWITIEGATTPILDERGEAELLLAVSRDVSERTRSEEERAKLEAQLRQAQKMEAVGRLAGGIAHDFNNLLTAIGGYGELALVQLPDDAPARRSVREMTRAGERAAVLTRQLLAFSRRQVLQPKVVDLNDVVTGLQGMLGRLLGEDVTLVTALADDLGQTRADPGQIEQVIMNLGINSRDAMPQGGRLQIETANVVLDEGFVARHTGAVAGEYVMLAVTDTGEGMDRATLERAFEPFFTTKPHGQGTGLGLATVYGIVKQTGGWVWAYSEPGLGSAFKVHLPRVWQEAEPERAPAGGPRLLGTETIMLVEDEEVVRSLVREMLEGVGYSVLEAADGAEALARSADHGRSIDLLLSDVVMPGMSGQQLAARLTAERPDLPVLFTSGYNEAAIANHGVLQPGTAFIEKPFTAHELTAKIRELLDGRPATGA